MIKNFDGILHQDRAKSILEGMVKKRRIHHSLLFTGPDGVGKKTTAIIFAKILNCTSLSHDLNPCETCDSCRLFNTFFITHSDFKIFSDIQNPLIIDRKFLIESISKPVLDPDDYCKSENSYIKSIEKLKASGFLLEQKKIDYRMKKIDYFFRNRDIVFKSKSDSFPDGQFLMSNLEKLMKSDENESMTAFKMARKLYSYQLTTTYFKSIKTDILREEFVDEINFRPYELTYKVFIIDEFEKMSANSENIVLKTLEEPPENSILILTTSKKQKLLPTILSRCMEIEFSEIPRSTISEFLLKHELQEEDDVSFIASMAGGNLERAIISDPDEILSNQQKILLSLKYLSSSGSASVEECLKEIIPADGDLNEKRNIVKDRLNIMKGLTRDIVLLKISDADPDIINLNIIKDLNKLESFFSEKGLINLIDLIDETLSDIEMNVDITIALESFLIKGKNFFKSG